MRWKEKEKPGLGHFRARWGFLFFPKNIAGEVRWLEFARWEERFTRGKLYDSWWEIRWLN